MKTTSPSKKIIPHSRPTVGRAEIVAVSEVIRSGYIAQGKKVEQFEQVLAREVNASYGVACNSGTSALHLTLRAMNIGPDDEVVFPSYVCTALLNAVRYVGASPVLAEIDPKTFNIDPYVVKGKLTKKTKAIIAPHLFGLPVDLEPLLSLGVPIIEDCAQAVGATYKGKKVGSMGYASIFSFYATKVMTTGEGGMVLSNAQNLVDRIRDIRDYDQKKDLSLRFNYKMTDLQAAMGLSQLGRLKNFIDKRRAMAEGYAGAFELLPVKLPSRDQGHIYYRYAVQVEKDIEYCLQQLERRGVSSSRPVFMPIHRYLKKKGYPNTDQVWRKTLSIPIYPTLSGEEQGQIIEAFIDVIRGSRL